MKLKNQVIADQNWHSNLHLRWRAVRAAHNMVQVTILCVNKQRQMSRLESSHLKVFSRNGHLTILTKSMQNTSTILILLSFKYSIDSRAVFSKSLFFHCHKKFHSLSIISKRVYIKVKFQKTEYDEYATSGVSIQYFSIIQLLALHLFI